MFSQLFFDFGILRNAYGTDVFCIFRSTRGDLSDFPIIFPISAACGVGDWFDQHCRPSQPLLPLKNDGGSFPLMSGVG
jgi:hypothetical protein